MVLNTTHIYLLAFELHLFVNGRKIETIQGFTGNYNDLDNRNTKLSEFMNDSHFLVASSNLKEFDNDKESVRMNLGLGTLATQDSNNVNINGGVAMFSNVNITDRLLYKSNM